MTPTNPIRFKILLIAPHVTLRRPYDGLCGALPENRSKTEFTDKVFDPLKVDSMHPSIAHEIA